jgi:hypothetical protein
MRGSLEAAVERRIREALRDEITPLVILGLTNSHDSTTLSPEMKVIGMKDPLRSEAVRHIGEEYRAWLAEVERIDWPGWQELLTFYPLAKRTGNDRAHFPLAGDGSGITADVFFGKASFIQLQEVVILAPGAKSPDQSTASIHSH